MKLKTVTATTWTAVFGCFLCAAALFAASASSVLAADETIVKIGQASALSGSIAHYLPFLKKINRQGVTGNSAFDSKGNIRKGLLSLYTYTPGKRDFVSVVQ